MSDTYRSSTYALENKCTSLLGLKETRDRSSGRYPCIPSCGVHVCNETRVVDCMLAERGA